MNWNEPRVHVKSSKLSQQASHASRILEYVMTFERQILALMVLFFQFNTTEPLYELQIVLLSWAGPKNRASSSLVLALEA